MDADKLIRDRLRVKRGDTLPYTGWHQATRLDLVEIFKLLEFKSGAEIGVAEGRFSKVMLDTVPGLRLLCVDPWQQYGRISQRICDERYTRAVHTLSGRNAEIMRLSSLAAAQQVPAASLDFVYIDGDHTFDAVMLDILLWAPKVKPGGIVAGHDYYEFYQAGVISAVRAYTQAHGIGAWYLTKEKEASWLWVKR